MTQVERRLITAVHERRLAAASRDILALGPEALDEGGRELAQSCLRACEDIGRRCLEQRQWMLQRLQTCGIAAAADETVPNESRDRQFHSFDIRVAEERLEEVVAIAAEAGYLPGAARRGPLQLTRRTQPVLTLARTDDVTMRMRIRWRESPAASHHGRRPQPISTDSRNIDLPRQLRLAYDLIHPLRALWNRRRGSGRSHLGPFSGTPVALIPQLLDFAGVTASDLVMDLGSGDGRILIEAASLHGCRGVGVESSESLVELARARAKANNVQDQVQFIIGDASTASVQEATLLFLFLPVASVRQVLATLRGRARPHARIVAHEQRPLLGDWPPARSRLLVGSGAITVAHLWTAS